MLTGDLEDVGVEEIRELSQHIRKLGLLCRKCCADISRIFAWSVFTDFLRMLLPDFLTVKHQRHRINSIRNGLYIASFLMLTNFAKDDKPLLSLTGPGYEPLLKREGALHPPPPQKKIKEIHIG